MADDPCNEGIVNDPGGFDEGFNCCADDPCKLGLDCACLTSSLLSLTTKFVLTSL